MSSLSDSSSSSPTAVDAADAAEAAIVEPHRQCLLETIASQTRYHKAQICCDWKSA